MGEGGSEGEGSRSDIVFVVVRACFIPEGNELIELVELKKKKLVKSIQSL